MAATERGNPQGPNSVVAETQENEREIQITLLTRCECSESEGKIEHFCKDDIVVSRNTFLPQGINERNEINHLSPTWEVRSRIVVSFQRTAS